MPAARPLAQRFAEKYRIDPASGCWLWAASIFKSGYGQAHVYGSNSGGRAHRISWLLHNGPIPDGMQVLHKCDVKHCVNPDHLFLGTQFDNMQDMDQKGRRADQPQSFNRATARELRASGWSYQKIGDKLGVSHAAVWKGLKVGQT